MLVQLNKLIKSVQILRKYEVAQIATEFANDRHVSILRPQGRRFLSCRQHGLTSKNAAIFTPKAVITSSLTFKAT